MNDFRKRRNMKREIPRMLLGSVGILALGALAYAAAHAAWDMYGKFAAAASARTDAETQLAQLQAQYAQVETQVTALNTPRGIEAAVRQRYGVAKPGEGEIDVVHTSSTTAPADSGGDSWFSRLWHSLFVW